MYININYLEKNIHRPHLKITSKVYETVVYIVDCMNISPILMFIILTIDFRQGASAGHAQLKFTENILKCLNDKEFCECYIQEFL